MELVFLNREDLSVLDYGYVEKDYQIVIDSVIPQKSTFKSLHSMLIKQT